MNLSYNISVSVCPTDAKRQNSFSSVNPNWGVLAQGGAEVRVWLRGPGQPGRHLLHGHRRPAAVHAPRHQGVHPPV